MTEYPIKVLALMGYSALELSSGRERASSSLNYER